MKKTKTKMKKLVPLAPILVRMGACEPARVFLGHVRRTKRGALVKTSTPRFATFREAAVAIRDRIARDGPNGPEVDGQWVKWLWGQFNYVIAEDDCSCAPCARRRDRARERKQFFKTYAAACSDSAIRKAEKMLLQYFSELPGKP